jgi:hypothetical protein
MYSGNVLRTLIFRLTLCSTHELNLFQSQASKSCLVF